MRTLFLDRDGVLNRKLSEGEWVRVWAEFEWLPGARQALRALHEAGWRLVVVTNQRGVATGALTAGEVDALHERMRADLAREGIPLAGVYVCPHDRGECDCRKPEPGLLLRAATEYPDIDFGTAALVGDRLSDLEAARRVGVPAYLVAGPDAAASLLEDAAARGIPVRGHGGSLREVADAFLLS